MSNFDVLQTGTTTISDQSFDKTNFVLLGTSASAAPTLQFLGGAGAAHPYSINSLLVQNGNVNLGFGTNLTVNNGVVVLDGQLSIGDVYSSATLASGGLIDANGTLTDYGGGAQGGGEVDVNGTLVVGSVGANRLDLPTVGGSGTILQTGSKDVTDIDGTVGSDVHLDIRAGDLRIASSFGSIKGTIGPASGKGTSIGATGTITYDPEAFNAGQVTAATFTEGTGMLSFLNSSGQTLGDPVHFSGNASGLNITVSGNDINITDHPGAASAIPIRFT